MDLSIIITAHNEGLLAHKTILSVFRALQEVPKLKYEIIVHIDNGDEATIKYFDRYRNDKRFKIFKNTFGDLGLSRNFAIKQSSGKYIQVLDADDLIGSSHIKIAIDTAKNDDSRIYHPEYVFYFGAWYKIKIQRNVSNKEEAAKILLSENDWCSMAFGKKELFINTPYRATTGGFGHEDWMFNIDTVNKGILHGVLKDAVLFYRKTGHSLVDVHIKNFSMQQYSELFDFSVFDKFNIPEKTIKSTTLSKKDKVIQLYKRARNNRIINAAITPVAEVAKKLTKKRVVTNSLPCDQYLKGEVLEQLINAGELDNSVIPTIEQAATMEISIPSENLAVTNSFIKVAKAISSKKIDYIFLVPWIETGGADKVILNYARAISEISTKSNILIIGTEKSKNEWVEKLPQNAIFINFGDMKEGLIENDSDLLLSRIILQTKCNRIHIINSYVGYYWVRRHLEYVKDSMKISASFFARSSNNEYNNILKYHDFADPYLIGINDVLSFVATDNESISDYLVNICGIDSKKIKVHYQPCEITEEYEDSHFNDGKIHILWASRICKEKNPELVRQIASKLDPSKFHLDIFGKMDSEYTDKFFSDIKAAEYHGTYNGITSLTPSKYNMFLYTSISDGLPNVLMEIAQYKVPIIASNAGGVKDFINNKTGVLINDLNSAEKYIEAIEKLANDKKLGIKLAKQAKDLVVSRHSWDEFKKTIKKDFIN